MLSAVVDPGMLEVVLIDRAGAAEVETAGATLGIVVPGRNFSVSKVVGASSVVVEVVGAVVVNGLVEVVDAGGVVVLFGQGLGT